MLDVLTSHGAEDHDVAAAALAVLRLMLAAQRSVDMCCGLRWRSAPATSRTSTDAVPVDRVLRAVDCALDTHRTSVGVVEQGVGCVCEIVGVSRDQVNTTG